MLVLSRRLGESVVIDGLGVITIVDIERGKVRLGFEFPQSIRIDRKEVADRKEDENEQDK